MQASDERRREQERRHQKRKEIISLVRDLPLEEVFAMLGCERSRTDKKKFKTAAGHISIDGNLWHNWNTQVGGAGAIDLALHIMGFDHKNAPADAFNRAVKVLGGDIEDLDKFRSRVEENRKKITEAARQADKPKVLMLPDRDDRLLGEMYDFLVKVREIPRHVVDRQVEAGVLYAGRPKGWNFPSEAPKNVVMLHAWGKKVWGAEMKSMDPRHKWSGMCTGSTREEGCYVVRGTDPEGEIVLLEAGVDAMAYAGVYPERTCISTGGCGNYKLIDKIKAETERQGRTLICAFDNDIHGITAAKKIGLMHHMPGFGKDWNDYYRDLARRGEIDKAKELSQYIEYSETGEPQLVGGPGVNEPNVLRNNQCARLHRPSF